MTRPRYQIAKEDVPVVHRWVRTRFRTAQWPKDWPELTAWDKFPLDNPTAKTLQQWCTRFLDAAQWKQLHAVIRAARRDLRQHRTVRLSRHAHATLRHLAERDHSTLSQVIERYLSDRANTLAAVQGVPTATPAPQPAEAPEDTAAPSAPGASADTAPADPPPRVMKVELYLEVENNNKFIRGKTKAREEIEWSVLHRYQMEKSRKDGWEYVLTIPYHTDEELDRIIYDILREATDIADARYCFIETDVRSLDDPERSW